MFYEERIMQGLLMCRSSPDRTWRYATTPHAGAVNQLMQLTDSQRLEVFTHFCTSCGTADPKCQCRNDE